MLQKGRSASEIRFIANHRFPFHFARLNRRVLNTKKKDGDIRVERGKA